MRQTQIVELQRRIRVAEAALRSVARALETLQNGRPEDDLAERIEHETRQTVTRRGP